MTKQLRGGFMCLAVNVCYNIALLWFISVAPCTVRLIKVMCPCSDLHHNIVNKSDNARRHSQPLVTLWVPSWPSACLFYKIYILALLFSPETDIKAPLPTQCPTSQFHCGANVCVDMVKVCDFSLDCPNGEDEAKCCEYPLYYFFNVTVYGHL